MRFTIRDLLWLMVVVGLAAGWFIDQRSSDARVNALKAERHKYIDEFYSQLDALSKQQTESDNYYKKLYPDKANERDEARRRSLAKEWERLQREKLLLPTQ